MYVLNEFCDSRLFLSNKICLKKLLSGGLSVGWAKEGMGILRDPDQKGIIGTLYPSLLNTQKGFSLGPLKAEIWAFFQIMGEFQLFYFEAINNHGTCFFSSDCYQNHI